MGLIWPSEGVAISIQSYLFSVVSPENEAREFSLRAAQFSLERKRGNFSICEENLIIVVVLSEPFLHRFPSDLLQSVSWIFLYQLERTIIYKCVEIIYFAEAPEKKDKQHRLEYSPEASVPKGRTIRGVVTAPSPSEFFFETK